MYEKIAVPLDGSVLAEAALPYTEYLAGRLGSDVTLVYVSELSKEPSQHMHELYLKKMAKAIKQGAQRYANKSEGRPIDVRSAILFGNPAEKIVEYADKEDIGLTVMATHSQSGIKQQALVSVADKVVRTTNCPVVLITANGTHLTVREKGILNKVLAPLDGSKRDETAISYIEELAPKLEAEVILFQVLAPECYTSGG